MRINPTTGEKICTNCKEIKTASDFGRNKIRPDGLHTECLECNAAYQRAKREDPEQKAVMLARTDSWRIRNPECIMLNSCKGRAKLKSLPCTISKNDIHIPDNCPVCETSIIRKQEKTGRGRRNSNSPSLDMYNPALGYVPGNIWVICDRCNRRKQDQSGEELLAFAFKIIDAFKEECERLSKLSSEG